MGIYSRDYVREPSGRNGGWGVDTPACKWLIIVTVVAFLLQLVTGYEGGGSLIQDGFALGPDIVHNFQIWRLVTYAFLHDQRDLLHIIFNMLGLWWFGAEIERLYGSKEFTFFYVTSAAVAGAGFVIWELAMAFDAPVVGASGAVLAVLTLYATHYPRHTIYIYGIIPVEIRWLIVLYIALDLWPVLLALNGNLPRSHVAHAAHLLGIVFGWLYYRNHWRLSNWIDVSILASLPRRWRQNRARQNLRVFDPEPQADLEGEVDRILAKIHEQGSASLTEREQAILTKASQQYKNRS